MFLTVVVVLSSGVFGTGFVIGVLVGNSIPPKGTEREAEFPLLFPFFSINGKTGTEIHRLVTEHTFSSYQVAFAILLWFLARATNIAMLLSWVLGTIVFLVVCKEILLHFPATLIAFLHFTRIFHSGKSLLAVFLRRNLSEPYVQRAIFCCQLQIY